MARKTKRRRKKNGVKVPVALVAGFVPGAIKTWEHWRMGGASAAGREAGRIYLGFDFWSGQFNPQWMTYGTFPIILGAVAHRIAGMLGINRALGNAGIPFIRF